MEEADLIPPIGKWDQSPSFRTRRLRLSEESILRLFTAESIQRLGMFLRLPQTTIATAQHIMQRFYFRVSFFDVGYRDVALGATFLAGKLEETPRTLREVVSCGYQLFRIYEGYRRPVEVLDLTSDKYQALREATVSAEQRILTELGYQVYKLAAHPYTYLLSYVEILGGDRSLGQVAWNYVNDSYRSTVCVSYSPQVIAVSAIFLASRKESNSALFHCPEPWWDLFQVSKPDLDAVSSEILLLYDTGKIYEEDVREILEKYTREDRLRRKSQSPRHHRSRSLSRTHRR